MRTEHAFTVAAERDRVWAHLMDVPSAAQCVPGVEDIVPTADGHRGCLRVRIGPVRLALEGEARVLARDDEAGVATLRLDAADGRLGGGLHADVTLAVRGSALTEVRIVSEIAVLGRIGELGQPLIQRKADETMGAFAACLERALGAEG